MGLFLIALWMFSYAVAGVITENGAAAHSAARAGYDRANAATAGMRNSSRPTARGSARLARGLGGLLGAIWGTLTGLWTAARDGKQRGLRAAPVTLQEARGRLPWRRGREESGGAPTSTDDRPDDRPPADPPTPVDAPPASLDDTPRPVAPPVYENGGGWVNPEYARPRDPHAIPASGAPTGGIPMPGAPTGEAHGISAARQQLAQFAAAAALYCDHADAAEAGATRDAATAASLVAAADQLEAGMRAGGVDGATLAEVAAIKDAAGLKQRAAEANKAAAIADRQAADALSAACRAATRGLNARQGGVEDAVKGSAHQVAKTEFLKD